MSPVHEGAAALHTRVTAQLDVGLKFLNSLSELKMEKTQIPPELESLVKQS